MNDSGHRERSADGVKFSHKSSILLLRRRLRWITVISFLRLLCRSMAVYHLRLFDLLFYSLFRHSLMRSITEHRRCRRSAALSSHFLVMTGYLSELENERHCVCVRQLAATHSLPVVYDRAQLSHVLARYENAANCPSVSPRYAHCWLADEPCGLDVGRRLRRSWLQRRLPVL